MLPDLLTQSNNTFPALDGIDVREVRRLIGGVCVKGQHFFVIDVLLTQLIKIFHVLSGV